MTTRDFIQLFCARFMKNMEPWPAFHNNAEDVETVEHLAYHTIHQVAREHEVEIVNVLVAVEPDSETELTAYIKVHRRMLNGQIRYTELMVEISEVRQDE